MAWHKSAFIAMALLAFVTLVFAHVPRTCLNVREAAINYKLASITEPGDGALFAVLRRPGRGVSFRPGDFDFYSFGNVSESNSLRYGSITKIFTGFFGLTKGISLNEKPSDYGFAPTNYPSSNVLRFRDVYSMESGISEYATAEKLLNEDFTDWKYGGAFTPALDIDLGWKQQPLQFQPATQFCYSNTNYELIGECVRIKTGLNISQHIANTFGTIAPTLNLDNGAVPVGGWPEANGYNNWPYPYALPGVSGTLRGKPRDLLVAYDKIIRDPKFNTMKTWHDSVPTCTIEPGSSIAAGNSYGFALQRYDPIFRGPAVGHDGDLIVRSLLVYHQKSDSIFLFHYTNAMANSALVSNTNDLIKLVLQD
jgi:CubicO group peptidase (beta-lactamase class C family)